jgi:hypothetical protein
MESRGLREHHNEELNMKTAVFWDVMAYGSRWNRCFVGSYHLYLPGVNTRELVTVLTVTSRHFLAP